MVAIGTGDGPPDLEAGVRLAEAYPFIYATVGVHPHDAAKADRRDVRPAAASCAAHPKVVAIGEIGLDYHYDFSPRGGAARGLRAATADWPRRPASRSSSTRARRGTDTMRDAAASSGAAGASCTVSRGGPAEARRGAGRWASTSASRGIVTFPKAAGHAGSRALTPRRPAAGGDRLRRTWRRCRTAASATSRPSWSRRRGALAEVRGVAAGARLPAPPRAISSACVCGARHASG